MTIKIIEVAAVPSMAACKRWSRRLIEIWATWKDVPESSIATHPDVLNRMPWVPVMRDAHRELSMHEPLPIAEVFEGLVGRLAVLDRIEEELARVGIDAHDLWWDAAKQDDEEKILQEGWQRPPFPRELADRFPESAFELAACDAAVERMTADSLGIPKEPFDPGEWTGPEWDSWRAKMQASRGLVSRTFVQQGLCTVPEKMGSFWVALAKKGIVPDRVVNAQPFDRFQFDDVESPFFGSDKILDLLAEGLETPRAPNLLVGLRSEALESLLVNDDPFSPHYASFFRGAFTDPTKRVEALATLVRLYVPGTGGGGRRKQKPVERLKNRPRHGASPSISV